MMHGGQNSAGPRNSPSISSLSRASPSSILLSGGGNVSRSSSPAMQGSSAGLNVTLGGTTPSFSTLTSLQSTISNISTTANSMYGMSYNTTQPTTYASTNPFLTGAYLNYHPGDMSGGYSGGGSNNRDNVGGSKTFFDGGYSSSMETTSSSSKYSTLTNNNNKTINNYDPSNSNNEFTAISSDSMKYNTIGGSAKYNSEKISYLSTSYSSDLKYGPSSVRESKSNSYDVTATSPNVTQSNSAALLSIEDTPTPTSSIETEDSNTREVGEKDVEGDGEQSD